MRHSRQNCRFRHRRPAAQRFVLRQADGARNGKASKKARTMGPLDALNHLANLFALPIALGGLAAALAKLAWWRELKAVSWPRLAWPASSASALATLGGLVVFGRDGKMATYGAMVLLCAFTLWWRGFASRRRG
jgi:hypothetical protein